MKTDAELVVKHLGAQKKIKELKEEVAKYEKLKTFIENEFLRRFQERGSENSRTEEGTAYISPITRFSVQDARAFMVWCVQNKHTDLLNIGIYKAPTVEYLGTNGGSLPPGVEMTEFKNINIRRT